jgi:hypothetical protein
MKDRKRDIDIAAFVICSVIGFVITLVLGIPFGFEPILSIAAFGVYFFKLRDRM